jgi:hypothetical protein
LIVLAALLILAAAPPASAVLVYQRPARQEIVAAHDNGSHPHVIAHGRSPVVSPDGTKAAFITGRDPYKTALRLVAVTGGRVRPLARGVSGGSPPDSIAWSPNSRYVTIGGLGRRELMVDVRRRTHRTIRVGDLPSQRAFSPDSSKLLIEVVYGSSQGGFSEIYSTGVRRGPARQVASGEGPAWGVGGLAYRDYSKGIVFRRGLGAKPQRIHSRGHADPRDWSADGDILLAAGGQYPDRLEALLIDRHTRKTRFVSERFSAIEDVSRNGRVVLGEAGGDVVAAWHDGSTKVLAPNAATPSWTK